MQASHREDALAIVQRLRDNSHVAYFAGGCVRDMLLGLEPKDFDVATDAPPQRVRELFSNTQAVGAAFGVILVRHGKSVIEVATFRTDVSYEDGRRPTAVRFTTAEEDAKRRDFTINGLFFDPIENKVIDYVGGQEDLKNKVLRAIGQPAERFAEDYLRLLRAVRFASRFGMTIDPATADAMQKHASNLRIISPERVGEEFRLMLMPRTRASAWRTLWEFSFAPEIFRGFEPPAQDAPRFSILTALPESDVIPFGFVLAAMIICYRFAAHGLVNVDPREWMRRDLVQRDLRSLRQTLRTNNDEHDLALEILTSTRELLIAASLSVSLLKRFLARPSSQQTRSLLGVLKQAVFFGDRIAAIEAELARLEGVDVAPVPFVTGDDLTAAGFSPGPVFKGVLDQVYDAQLEDRVNTKDEAMKLALELAREGKS